MVTILVKRKGIERASINIEPTAMRVSTAYSGGEVEQGAETTQD